MVEIKKLEWRPEPPYHVARVFRNVYAVEAWDGGVTLSGIPGRREFKTVEAAKAAAQSDFETRIRSAIVDVPAVEPEPVATYFSRQIEWSRATFGPALRTKGVIDHIRKELAEIEREPHDLSEWIDVVILAMDGFWRHGGNAEDLLPALLAKQRKNMARVWPDWRTMSEDSAIEHDRSHDAHPPRSALVNAQADADVVESLDDRMKAAGMYTVSDMMGVTPLTKWMSNPAINTIEAFSEWLDRKVSEYLRMKAAYDLGDKDESDELYEWVQAHSAVYSTIRDQFQVVRSSGSAEVGSATSSTDTPKGDKP